MSYRMSSDQSVAALSAPGLEADMADFFSSTCNSALRAAPVRPPDTGDTAGRLRGPWRWGGRERAPGVPAALATVGPFSLVVGSTVYDRFSTTHLQFLLLLVRNGHPANLHPHANTFVQSLPKCLQKQQRVHLVHLSKTAVAAEAETDPPLAQ